MISLGEHNMEERINRMKAALIIVFAIMLILVFAGTMLMFTD